MLLEKNLVIPSFYTWHAARSRKPVAVRAYALEKAQNAQYMRKEYHQPEWDGDAHNNNELYAFMERAGTCRRQKRHVKAMLHGDAATH